MSFHIRKGDVTISGDFSQLEKLVQNLGTNYSVDVGLLGSAAVTQEGGKTIAGIGAEHEFGLPNRTPPLPRRSFIRFPIQSGQQQIENDVGKRYQQHMEDGDIKAIFTDIGLACEARIQDAFDSGGFGEWKQLSEITVERKQSSAILIDTGQMRQAVSSKVNG